MDRWTVDQPKVVTMLAEIFMVRLEAAARVPQETIPVSSARFVPFHLVGSFDLKKNATDAAAQIAAKSKD